MKSAHFLPVAHVATIPVKSVQEFTFDDMFPRR